uniref:Uncharacterized protein n=1 Tax=Timema poppense TaxID=170557 RepID=A0A7R9DTU1_TIMPO|nr:unnamed protein product [Timema poppensis]
MSDISSKPNISKFPEDPGSTTMQGCCRGSKFHDYAGLLYEPGTTCTTKYARAAISNTETVAP